MIEKHNRFEQRARSTLILFVLAVIIVIDLIAGQLVLARRSNRDLRIQSPYYHHDLRTNFSGDDSWGPLSHKIYTNDLGFKDKEVRKVPLVTEKYRLLFMGDSFTEGIGVKYEDTFVGRIEVALAPKGYDVLNAGVASYSPRLYYLKTKRLLEKGLRFDELVVFSDISDVQDEVDYSLWVPTTEYSIKNIWRKSSRAADHFFEGRSLIYLHMIRPTLFGVTWDRIKTKFKFTEVKNNDAEIKHHAERGRWAFDDEVYEEWGRKGVAHEINYMDRLYELTRAHGIKMSLAVYPWPVTLEHDTVNSRRVTTWQNYVRGRDITFYDFFPTFFSTTTSRAQIIKDTFIPGDVHWNSAGHKIIADAWLKMYSYNNKSLTGTK